MDLRQLLRTLRRRWKFVAVTTLLGVGGAFALLFTVSPTYQSEARVYIAAPPSGGLDAYTAAIYASQRAASYADLAHDPELLERVIATTGVPDDWKTLSGKVSADVVPNTVILGIRATYTSPQQAQELARAEANEIVRLIAKLEAPSNKDVETPIVARLSGDASFEPAQIAPRPTLNVIIGLMLGFLLGVAGAVLRDLLDTSTKTPEDLIEASGTSLMAVVPFDGTVPKHPLISDPGGSRERVEAFRVLRTNLQYVDLDAKHQMLMVSSAAPDEGKTVTATNLAIALAQTGRRVLLLDCDFRKPRVGRLLGLENSVGLLTVLIGRGTLADVTQSHHSGLDFIGTGPTPPNPTEVLETQAMRDLLAQLRVEYDAVIVDGPPALPVADAAIIAPMTDGVLLITRYGATKREAVRQTAHRLSAVGGRLVGAVLNMAPRAAIASYGYGYGYGYGEIDVSLIDQRRGQGRRIATADDARDTSPGRE